MQDRYPEAQRTVRQHEAFDIFRRTDELTLAAKARGKVIAELLEWMNMRGLFAGEPDQRASPIIIAAQLCPGVVDGEWQNELFNQTEHAEVLVAADLVQDPFLVAGQEA